MKSALPPIVDRPIRVAVVGCGRISGRHFSAIEAHGDDMELVAVCDSDPEVLASGDWIDGVGRYHSYSEMLQAEELDAVTLCTPSGSHAGQAVAAAAAGRHVITEKPMATRWSDALGMVKACDRAGVQLFVVKQNRSNSTLQLLRRAVDERRFGRIFMVHVNVFWTRPQEYYDSSKWRGTWELDGGAFMNQASHYVDLLDWLIGPVADVQAMTGTLARNIEVEDTGVVNVRWRNGALGSMSVTMLTYPQNLEGSITILGENGTVRIGGVAVNKVERWEFEDERDYDHTVDEASYQTESVYGFGHGRYYRNVIGALRGEEEAETDGREGLRSLEILIAAYMSARDGRTISLPLEY